MATMKWNWDITSRWILKICDKYKYNKITFHTSIVILAYFIKHSHISIDTKSKWKLYACSSIHIASCTCDNFTLTYNDYVIIGTYTFTINQFSDAIRDVLRISYPMTFPRDKEPRWWNEMPQYKKIECLKKPKCITRVKKLGCGAFGTVYSTNKTSIVVKRIHPIDNNELYSIAIREIAFLNIMNKLDCGTTLIWFDVFSTGIVDIYMTNEGNSLSNVLRIKAIKREYARLHIYDLLCTLYTIHKMGIAHRDIKPDNILIKNNGKDATLCDWGAARAISTTTIDIDLTHYIVTRWFRAPELFLKQEQYTSAIDIWSLGIVMTEYAGVTLLYGDNSRDQVFKIFQLFGTPEKGSFLTTLPNWDPKFPKYDCKWFKSDQYLSIRSYWGEEGANLITKMLTLDPSKRITAEEAMEHPFFESKN